MTERKNAITPQVEGQGAEVDQQPGKNFETIEEHVEAMAGTDEDVVPGLIATSRRNLHRMNANEEVLEPILQSIEKQLGEEYGITS